MGMFENCWGFGSSEGVAEVVTKLEAGTHTLAEQPTKSH